MARVRSMGGLAKQRSGWLAPAISFFAAACFSAVVLAYYLAPGPPGLGEELPAPTDATRAVDLTVGTARFRIPANYIQLSSARRGGALAEVALAARLPQMEGYTVALAQDFTGNNAESPILHFTIRSGGAPRPEAERLERIYRLQVQDPQGEPHPSGLTRYAFREESGYRAQELFTGLIDGQPIVMLCDRTAPDTPSPNCLRDVPYGEELGLSYRFKRAYLAQWRDIDTGLRKLIAGFVPRE